MPGICLAHHEVKNITTVVLLHQGVQHSYFDLPIAGKSVTILLLSASVLQHVCVKKESNLVAGINKSQRELFLETLICNVDPHSRLLMSDMVPTGLAFHSNHPPNGFGSSRHIGYIVHGQHEVKVSHKCDAVDSADAAPLTQEREGSLCPFFSPPPQPSARFP